MKILKSAAVAACVVAFAVAAPNAGAVSVTVQDIGYEWTNTVGGGGTVTNNGAQTSTTAAELRWGDPLTTNGKSGYDFAGVGVPFISLDNVAFALGDFTHLNNVIASGTSITSTQLDVTVTIGDGVGPTGDYLFSFLHNETPNSTGTSPADDDIVTVGNLVTSDTFMLGGQLLTLSILGFSTDGGVTISNVFSSPEGGNNTAALYATFTAPVPLPAAGWMFLTGLAGLGIAGRRRMKKKAANAAA